MTDNLVWEDLGVGSLQILQDKNGYCFTSDAVILANFVSTKKNDLVCEFGTGSGIISILIAYKENPKHIFAFDIQKNVIARASQSIKENKQEEKITLICDDLSNANNVLQKKVDIVVCNPPYQKNQSGLASKNEEISISKNEIKTDLSQIIKSANKILCENGKLYLCINPERIAECIYKLKENKLEPKKMFFSYPSVLSSPSCAFFECVKNGKEDLKVLPPLITHNDKGDYVAVIKKLFKKEWKCFILLERQLAI